MWDPPINESAELTRGALYLIQYSEVACPKFDIVGGLAISLAYPSGEERGNFPVQMISTCLATPRGREGAGMPCGMEPI